MGSVPSSDDHNPLTPSSNGRECLKLQKGANSTNRVSLRFFYATRNQHKSQQILENQNMIGKDSE